MTTRPPAVAGSFYPAASAALDAMVRELLADARPVLPNQAPKALISPHAGYIYSGSTAAHGYAALHPPVELLVHSYQRLHYKALQIQEQVFYKKHLFQESQAVVIGVDSAQWRKMFEQRLENAEDLHRRQDDDRRRSPRDRRLTREIVT